MEITEVRHVMTPTFQPVSLHFTGWVSLQPVFLTNNNHKSNTFTQEQSAKLQKKNTSRMSGVSLELSVLWSLTVTYGHQVSEWLPLNGVTSKLAPNDSVWPLATEKIVIMRGEDRLAALELAKVPLCSGGTKLDVHSFMLAPPDKPKSNHIEHGVYKGKLFWACSFFLSFFSLCRGEGKKKRDVCRAVNDRLQRIGDEVLASHSSSTVFSLSLSISLSFSLSVSLTHSLYPFTPFFFLQSVTSGLRQRGLNRAITV